jgi:protein gp37
VKVSQGCKHCYAQRMAKRLHAMGAPQYRNGFEVTLHEDLLKLPRSWRQPRLVFVNSMSDLFQVGVPLPFIQRVFATMQDCPQHTFQILAKRSDRLLELASYLPWPRNV